MSEFESYHFERIYGQLTEKEMEFAYSFSSRMQVTPRSAYVEYNYGGGGWDHRRLLLRGFDAHLHFIAWVGGRLAFRFDTGSVDLDALRPFCVDRSITLTEKQGSIILDVAIYHENGVSWPNHFQSGSNPFLVFHEHTQLGDYRWLYICWIMAVLTESQQDAVRTPPAVFGMDQLEPTHYLLADFFQHSPDLIDAAVALAPKLDPETIFDPDEWLDSLCPRDMRRIVRHLVNSPRGAHAELLKTLRERHREGIPAAANPPPGPDIHAIENEARRIAKERKQEQIREAEMKQAEFATAVWKHHATLISRVDQLVAEKNTKSYDTAVRILKAIRQACRSDDHLRQLYDKTLALRQQHPRLVGLRSRLEEAVLCEGIDGRIDSSFLFSHPDETREHLDWPIFEL
jgi:hypothetical protein